MVPRLATKDDPMTKLSDTQSIILSAAAQRTDGNVLPLPGSLRGGAATKVVAALLARGLIREQIIDSSRKADAAMNTVWRNLDEPDGRGVLLYITAAGAEAIGVEPASVPYAFNEGINSAGEPAAGGDCGLAVRVVPGDQRVPGGAVQRAHEDRMRWLDGMGADKLFQRGAVAGSPDCSTRLPVVPARSSARTSLSSGRIPT